MFGASGWGRFLVGQSGWESNTVRPARGVTSSAFDVLSISCPPSSHAPSNEMHPHQVGRLDRVSRHIDNGDQRAQSVAATSPLLHKRHPPWRIPAAALLPDARKREFAIRFAKNSQTVPQQADELALRLQLPTTGRGEPNCGDVSYHQSSNPAHRRRRGLLVADQHRGKARAKDRGDDAALVFPA